jgi:hypothetical protein
MKNKRKTARIKFGEGFGKPSKKGRRKMILEKVSRSLDLEVSPSNLYGGLELMLAALGHLKDEDVIQDVKIDSRGVTKHETEQGTWLEFKPIVPIRVIFKKEVKGAETKVN